MVLSYSLAGLPTVREHEPWGKAFTSSFGAHIVVTLLFVLSPFKEKAAIQNVITEINFVETAVETSREETGAAPNMEARAAGAGGSHTSA